MSELARQRAVVVPYHSVTTARAEGERRRAQLPVGALALLAAQNWLVAFALEHTAVARVRVCPRGQRPGLVHWRRRLAHKHTAVVADDLFGRAVGHADRRLCQPALAGLAVCAAEYLWDRDSPRTFMPFTCEQLILLTHIPTQDNVRESFISGHEGLRMSGLEALSRPLLLQADTPVDPLASLMTLPPDLSSHTATHLSGLNLLEQIIARQRAQQVWDELEEDKNGALPRDIVLLCSERLLAQFSMSLLLNIKRQLQRSEGPRMPEGMCGLYMCPDTVTQTLLVKTEMLETNLRRFLRDPHGESPHFPRISSWC